MPYSTNMGHTLQLNIPDDLYEILRGRAEQQGTTPEQVAEECLSRSAMPAEEDPLLLLAGVLDSELGDIAELHNLYIGRALAEEVTPRGDA